jgi:hypothetical protein
MDRSLLRRFDGNSHEGHNQPHRLGFRFSVKHGCGVQTLRGCGALFRRVGDPECAGVPEKVRLRWQVLTPRKIDLDSVSMLVCVDVRAASRIGPFASLLERRTSTYTCTTIILPFSIPFRRRFP